MCAAATTPIHALAGSSAAAVRVRGVVTAVFPGLRGFFLESPRAAWDARAATPEGIFVYAGRHALTLASGEIVEVDGRYQLFHGTPEVSRLRAVRLCGRALLPPAVAVRLSPGRRQPWSALVGMRVRFTQALTIDDLFDLGRYGEVRAAAAGRRYAPTAVTAPGAGAVVLGVAAGVRSIWLDDGSFRGRPPVLQLAGKRFDAEHPLRAGQILRHVTGIAYRAFGRDVVEVQSFRLDEGANPRRPVADLHLPTGLRIVTFNVDNYFDRAYSGAAFPTERGARSAEEFACQTHKLVAALAQLHPAVIALQEVENNGFGAGGALAVLVAALNRAVPGAAYRFVDPGMQRLGSDLIAPSLVYDAHRLVRTGRVALLAATATAPKAFAAGLKRPALAATFRERAHGWAFTVISLHLRSKRSPCHGGLDGYRGTDYCAQARTAAARRVSAWLQRNPTGVKTAARALAGDFNAYQHEGAVRVLLAARWALLPAVPAGRVSYSETARAGAGELDYVFVSPAFARRVRASAIWHIDADEAPVFSYGGRPACRGPSAPFRASDHDPVVVVVNGRA